MNRREVIRNAALISAGATLLISCQDKASMILKNIPLTGADELMLETLAATLVPKTEFIGAIDLKAQDFVLMMADDCMSPVDQAVFADGMKQFHAECRRKFNQRFTKCTPAQRSELLNELEGKKDDSESITKFYRTVKRYTLQQFTSSQEYMVQVRKYDMVPGPFKGCVPVKGTSQAPA